MGNSSCQCVASTRECVVLGIWISLVDAMRCDAMRCDAMRCDAMRRDALLRPSQLSLADPLLTFRSFI
eukprot:1330377-Amorphochlora_amoeboformis.AAC.1